MLPFITAFGITFPMYGVLSATGMLAAFVLLWFVRKHTRFSEDQALSAALWAIIMGFLGAKVLYWIVEIDQIIADPAYLIRTLREGFVFYGALIGGLGGVAIYALRKKLPFFSLTDYFIPALVIGHAFGRIGCHLAGCCYGMACDLPISVVFPCVRSSSGGSQSKSRLAPSPAGIWCSMGRGALLLSFSAGMIAALSARFPRASLSVFL
jgi:phosphatidylglycerol:prolipoprotein diacylglycerol transferase